MALRFLAALFAVLVLSVGASVAAVALFSDGGGDAKKAAALETRIAGLESEIEILKSKIDDYALRGRERIIYRAGDSSAPSYPGDSPGSLNERNAPAAAGHAGRAAGTAKEPPLNEGAVEEIARKQSQEAIRKMREDEAARWQAQREEHAQEWRDNTDKWLDNVYSDRLKTLGTELNLSSSQEYSIRAALDDRKVGIMKFYEQEFQSHGAGADNASDTVRVSWAEIDKKYQDELERILTADQWKTYKEKGLDDFQSPGGGGPWGGRRPRNQDGGSND
jgi:hypothetical protein